MKTLITFLVLICLTFSSCVRVQGKGGYAAKPPKNKSAWK